MTGYEYGNTRLRAMRSRLLAPAFYSELLAAGSVDRLLGALHDTPYGPDVETAIARYEGLRRLDEAVRANLAGTLRAMLSFYQDQPGQRVGLLLRRWDLYNLTNLFRGRARLAGTNEILPMLVPAGNLSDAELSELAGQRSLRSVVDLMVAWGLPSPRTARRLLSAWPEYEASGDLAAFERVLHRAWAETVDEELGEAEPADALATTIRTEIDRSNLITVLRLHSAQLAGEPDAGGLEQHLLTGGHIPHPALKEILLSEDRPAAATVLAENRLPPGWDAALATWAENGDLAALAMKLDELLTRDAISRFSTGDPLGISIPVAFTFAKENEARNLRLIGRGLIHGLASSEVSQQLVVAA